jgi:hypothetical protein
LLQPQETDGTPFSKTSLDIPDAFDLNTGAKYENVSRDTADITNPSDWYELCGLEQQKDKGVTRVSEFIR